MLQDVDALAAMKLPDLLKAIGTKLVMKVGGASGPLYGTLFLALGKELPAEPSRADAVTATAAAVAAVKARGKSEIGQKTMLDVLVPAYEAFAEGAECRRDQGNRGVRSRSDDSDAGDAWARFVSRRTFDRSPGSRRALRMSDDHDALR